MKIFKIFAKNLINQSIGDNKWPKRYRSEFIEPGIVSYEDLGMGMIYVGNETLENMLDSFIGKPVVNEVHQDLTPKQAFKISNKDLESMADGVVYEVGKLPNGWYYCDMIIWDEETKNNIENNGYNVSCAYIVDKSGPNGTYHGLQYDEEVLEGTYTHNAIVENPRYEGAKIYPLPSSYQNSMADEAIQIITNAKGEDMRNKIFKHILNSVKGKTAKNAEPPKDDEKDKEKDEKENGLLNMEGAMIETEDGQQISLEEAVNAYKTMKENGGGQQKPKTLTMQDTVDVDGEMINVSDLVAACGAVKQNAEPPQDVVAEDVVDDPNKTAVQNSKPQKKANHFKIVKNAAERTQEERVLVNTKTDRLKRGRERYGTKEAN
jgi:hypothetical protein